jgi:hypothetical protein
MSVEAVHWQARCNVCDELYGDYHASREEAETYDDEGGGRCSECLNQADLGEETP